MVMRVLFILLFNLGSAEAIEVISGSYGRASTALSIIQSVEGVLIEGDFLGRKYDYSISAKEKSYLIKGTLDALELNMSLHPSSGVTGLIDDSSKTDVTFSLNSYVNFINGKFLGHGASLRIEKTDKEHRVTGFLLKHLFDLYISRTAEGIVFEGYSNGYWTNLQILQVGPGAFRIFGHFQNNAVDLEYSGAHLDISDLIELIIFKIHFPGLNLINFQ